ncbi:Uu.00g071890.m01.CDS01 [Anthostomella pinea]|uniref:RING-type E3 ubiquitin transferase n=1 Tax=Anthostomella pinea TaxID=933095 RepID=A0AAI8VVR7_9PEZI|nr:Uu.00g071890.m01.CDS01 [Anthostomella pinea]
MPSIAAVANMACLLLGLASLLPVASADDAIVTAMEGLPAYFTQFYMTLSLNAAGAPVPYAYNVAPLTEEAGLNQTNQNSGETFNVQGNVNLVDQANFNNLSLQDSIVYMSCDSNIDSSNISPSYMLNQLMTQQNNQPKAILLYSANATYCSVGGSNLAYTAIWTMTVREQVLAVKTLASDSTNTIRGTISGNNTSTDNPQMGQQGGSNSAVAMSILYSITGLITLLFLAIIATGAIRAHRHPERYGPRASIGGRPRQSRAKGLARAMLETLPIVKFGDPEAPKPDAENELQGILVDRKDPIPQVRVESANTDEQPRTSAEASSNAATQSMTTKDATAADAAADAATSEDNQKEESPIVDERLGCSICTEDFVVGEDVRVLPCDHKFHPACVDPWLVNVSGTCPLCRLDLRPEAKTGDPASSEAPPEDDPAAEGAPAHPVEPSSAEPAAVNATPVSAATAGADGGDVDATQRRRVSRLLDWNRLRHASVDERITALRQFRQSQQATSPESATAHDETRRVRLADRMRERFHIRTHRAHTPGNTRPTSS